MLHGGAGNDVLAAGSNDTGGWQELYGEAGNDTYLIGHADGKVRIGSAAEGATTGRADRVVFTDLALSEVEFTYHGSPRGDAAASVEGVALVVRWTKDGVSGEVHIAEMGRHIERFEFADGSVLGEVDANWRARYSPAMYSGDTQDRLMGTEQDDVIMTGALSDRLEGRAGNDVLGGGSSRDELYGGAGDDTLIGGEGNDALVGGGGADELHGEMGDDALRGGTGDDVLLGGAGRDWLRGEDGDDTLEAGDSDGPFGQLLDGGFGDDTYRIGKGDGLVTIDSYAENADTGSADRVVFTDLSLADVSLAIETEAWPTLTEDGELVWTDHHTLVVGWTKDGQSGRLEVADSGRHIERFEFADGSVLGRFDAQRLEGTAQAERIATGSGDDRMDGGAGNDTLSGGAGNDTYEFSGRSFGHDRVSDTGGSDTVAFTSDVAWDQLWFSRNGSDLLIELMGTESEVTVEGWWSGALNSEVDASRQVETIEAGEYALAASAVQQLVQAMAGMDAPASGQTTLSAAQRQQIATPLAAWQELTGS